MDIDVNEAALEEALATIERARSWGPRVVSRLEHLVRTAPDEDVFRVNPIGWAADRGVDEYEAVDLFLFAAKAGLFFMDWNVICLCCGKVMESLRDLHGLVASNSCTVCYRHDRATLDDYVQVTFTVAPSIRRIRFHEPESLSLDEYCYTYLFEPSARLSGHLTARQMMTTFQRHLSPFSPGERITVETATEVGILSCLDLYSGRSFALLAEGEQAAEPQRVSAVLTDRGFEVSLPARDPAELQVLGVEYAGSLFAIRPGLLVIDFEQRTTVQAALAVIYFPIFGVMSDTPTPLGVLPAGLGPGSPATNVAFASPRLTARRLFATQTFHDLFPAQAFREAEGFALKEVTILFTDLKGSTQLYQRIGDLNAYELVREHYGVLGRIVARRHGAVVKTIGDAIMATFDRPPDAVGAGIDMLQELRELNRSSVRGDLVLKIGAHRGAAISVTLNDRIDYFGQTVNIAARVQGSADGNEMDLSRELYEAPGVADVLERSGMNVEEVQVPLRGIDTPVAIYRVAAAAPTGA